MKIRDLMFFLILTTGCAGLINNMTASSGNSSNSRGYLGLTSDVVKGNMHVIDVFENSPASRAGLKYGDIILSFNGTEIHTREDRLDYFDYVVNSPGKELELMISRNNNPLKITVSLEGRPPLDQDILKIISLVTAGDIIKIAFVVDKVGCVSCGNLNISEWREGVKTTMLSQTEEDYINIFRRQKNFKIIDRYKVEQILKELNFQMTGAVSPEQIKSIGKLSGATHIGFLSLMRFPEGNQFSDTFINRVIDVGTGDVVASRQTKSKAS